MSMEMTMMKKSAKLAAIAMSLLLGTAMVACGDNGGESNENNSTTNNPSDNSTPGETPGTPIDDLESSYKLRFTAFEFTQDPGMSLNGLIRINFNQDLEYPIVVLVELDDIDPSAGTLRMRGGSGLKTETDGEYRWDPDTASAEYVDGTVSSEGQIEAVLPLLPFVATVVSESGVFKTVIPIRQLEVDALLRSNEEGGVFISRGEMTGFVTKEEADSVEVALSPTQVLSLTAVLQERRLNHDTTGDGVNDAWLLKARFDAEETIIVD
jgi:hypothetical protein